MHHKHHIYISYWQSPKIFLSGSNHQWAFQVSIYSENEECYKLFVL